jgi:hypothetical protein
MTKQFYAYINERTLKDFIYSFICGCTQCLALARQAHFHLSHSTSVGYFPERVLFYAYTGLDYDAPICAPPCSWEYATMTGVWHHVQPLVEVKSHKLFVQAGL